MHGQPDKLRRAVSLSEMCSHFLPRTVVISLSHILIDCQLDESSELTHDEPVVWLLMMVLDQGYVVHTSLGAVRLYMDPKARLGFSDIALIHPEGECLQPGAESMRIYVFVFMSD